MFAILSTALTLVAALCAAMAAAGVVYTVAAGRLIGGYGFDGPTGAGDGRPSGAYSVALLKPLHGAEPRLRANLETFLAQDHPGAVTLWLGVQGASDGALAVARAFAAEHPEVVRVVLDDRRRAANAKIGNVMNVEEAALATNSELVIVTDSDISVAPHWLSTVAAALERPQVGLATCLYFGVAARPTFAARMAAMGISYNFLPQSAAGVAIGVRPAMGSTLALRRETLAAVGGFASVKDKLADDYELGREVTRLGLELATPHVLVGHDCAESTARELWRHELRWAATIRNLNPAGYLGSSVTHTAPLAAIAVLASGFTWWAWIVLAVAVAARLWLKGRVDRAAAATTGPWWMLPLRDVLSLAVFVVAWFHRRVEWRGARFHVGRDGELTPV